MGIEQRKIEMTIGIIPNISKSDIINIVKKLFLTFNKIILNIS